MREHEYQIHGVPISQETERVTKLALALIWDKHVDEPGLFVVGFFDRVLLTEGAEEIPVLGAYSIETGEISLAMENRSKKHTGIPLIVGVGLVIAHEGTHKLQHFLGKSLSPSYPQLKNNTYPTQPQEEFAWREAVDVIKAIFPAARGYIIVSGVKYQIPRKSTY